MNTNHRFSPRWSLAAAALALLAMTSLSSAQSNADLSSLVPSAGTLAPVFASGTLEYTATVPYATGSITVTPTAADPVLPTITVNGNPVASNTASPVITLSVGVNPSISIVVMSQDSSVTKIYTLTVTRIADSSLSGLLPSTGNLSPTFASGTTSYTSRTPYATSSMTVTPAATDPGATITVNGNAVASGNPSGAITLTPGANTITTVVTSSDSLAATTYTLTVNVGIAVVSQAEGFADSTKTKVATAHLGTTLLSYNATGVDKLVVAIGLEAGFNANTTNVTGVTFNGVALTQAVEENTKGGPGDAGSAEIWYLDNPPQVAANIGYTATSSAGGTNGAHVSILGLAYTAAGFGSTDARWTNLGPATGSITTTGKGSLVVAMVENSGNNNASGEPNVVAPLTLSNRWVYGGSSWVGTASGYQSVPSVGTTITPTFTTNTGTLYSIHVIAVEFKVPVPTQYWDVNGAMAGAGGPAAAGTWDGSITNWNPKADGSDPVAAWSAGSVAVFAASNDAMDPYLVTVDGTQDFNGFVFEEGTVTLANGTSGALRLTAASAVNVTPGLAATIELPLFGTDSSSSLAKVGAGLLSLAGDLSYTGATVVAQGTLALAGNNAAATGGMVLNGGVTRFESLESVNGTARDVTINPAGVLVFGASFGDTNIPTALANRVVDTSAGVVAADNYAGTDFNFNTPGLTAAYFHSVGSVTYAGMLTPYGTTYRLGGGGGTLTMTHSDAITGVGNSLVVKGNVALSAANNYDSGTTLNAGTLAVGDDGALGSGALTINGGIIQSIDATAHVLANALILGADVTVGGTGDLTFSDTSATALGATRILTINNPASTFAQAFSGTGFGITKAGTGAMTLSGANTYTGATTVNAGMVTLSGSNSSAGATNLTQGTLKLGGSPNAGLASGIVTIGNPTLGNAIVQILNGDQVITNAVTLNQANVTISGAQSLQVDGIFTHSGGNRALTNNLDTGKALTLAGQVKLSEHATTGRTLTINGTGATAISGQIVNGGTGAGGLTKTGTGTLTLTNTNAYTGATNVTGGTLAVSGSGAINTSASIILNGAAAAFMHNSSVTNTRTFTLTNGTLGGTGTISTALTAGANVTLAPGDRTLATPAKGTLTVTNGVSLTAASSKLNLRLFGPTADDSDKLVQNTTGTVALAGALNVTIDGSWTPVAGTTYDLIDWITATGTFSAFNLPTLATGFKWHDYGSGVFFDYATGQIQIDADSIPPTLAIADIVDDKGGASVQVNTLVTYTISFSEDMNSATVNADDFGNAGTSAITIGTITETSPSSGVFTVQVTPTTDGSLQLQVLADALINDAAGNPLDTTFAIVDETSIAVTLAGYASWKNVNGTGGGLGEDHDNDGVDNGLEYFIGGPNGITTGFTPLPGVVNTAGVLSVTWIKAADYTGTYGTDFFVETSATLSGVWTTQTLGVSVIISGNEVKFTFPAGTSNFARLKVTGP